MTLILSILAAFFSILGNILIVFKKRISFAIWMIGNCLWIWESFIDSLNIPLIIMNGVYLIINATALHEWTKNKNVHRAIDNRKENKNEY